MLRSQRRFYPTASCLTHLFYGFHQFLFAHICADQPTEFVFPSAHGLLLLRVVCDVIRHTAWSADVSNSTILRTLGEDDGFAERHESVAGPAARTSPTRNE